MTISLDEIQGLLESDNFGEQIRGLNHLRNLDPAIAFPLLKPLVTHNNPRIRYSAVSQLDPIGQANPAESLIMLRDRLFNDPEMDVQAAAADVIGGLKLTDAYPDLENAYQQTSDWLLQMSIVATLGEMGDARGFDLLKLALGSENSLIRMAAISALGELGNPAAITFLMPLVNDDDWQVRYRLAQSLSQLDSTSTRPTLEQLSHDSAEQVAAIAKELLLSLA